MGCELSDLLLSRALEVDIAFIVHEIFPASNALWLDSGFHCSISGVSVS